MNNLWQSHDYPPMDTFKLSLVFKRLRSYISGRFMTLLSGLHVRLIIKSHPPPLAFQNASPNDRCCYGNLAILACKGEGILRSTPWANRESTFWQSGKLHFFMIFRRKSMIWIQWKQMPASQHIYTYIGNVKPSSTFAANEFNRPNLYPMASFNKNC